MNDAAMYALATVKAWAKEDKATDAQMIAAALLYLGNQVADLAEIHDFRMSPLQVSVRVKESGQ